MKARTKPQAPKFRCGTCWYPMEDLGICWACGEFLCRKCQVENGAGEWVCPACAKGEACTCDTHQTLRAMVAP
jgi:hypothetical protein